MAELAQALVLTVFTLFFFVRVCNLSSLLRDFSCCICVWAEFVAVRLTALNKRRLVNVDCVYRRLLVPRLVTDL